MGADGIFRRTDLGLTHIASQPAWPRTGWGGLAVAATAYLTSLQTNAVLIFAFALSLTPWAWWMLHHTKQITVFDGAARELWFGSSRWPYWKPEPAPRRKRTINFQRIGDIAVERSEDEENRTVSHYLVVHLVDGERLYLATRLEREELDASARVVRQCLETPASA